ncbi:MAG: hypothetical protein CXT78_01515 [Thaumarchaeota archaeon]|jgi:preprotein translocase subunit SecG|nr:MAG: hypothetical protein CXT78_01515 [Nitrososphaerota archaeon]
MKLNKNWIRSRWLEERFGHAYYLMFALTLVNFVLISYRYFVEQDPKLQEIIPNLSIFTIILVVFYIPVSILIGYWHKKTQLSTENTIKRLEDPLLAHICRIILDTRIGNTSKKEVNELKELLSKIDYKGEEENQK